MKSVIDVIVLVLLGKMIEIVIGLIVLILLGKMLAKSGKSRPVIFLGTVALLADIGSMLVPAMFLPFVKCIFYGAILLILLILGKMLYQWIFG